MAPALLAFWLFIAISSGFVTRRYQRAEEFGFDAVSNLQELPVEGRTGQIGAGIRSPYPLIPCSLPFFSDCTME